MSDPNHFKRIELILRQLDQIPTLPSVALRVLEITSDPDASMTELARVVETDLALTVSILHHVRRADLAVAEEINSVERAIVLLGLETVRGVVLAVSVFETLESGRGKSAPPTAFVREEFWKHSIAVACCAEMLAETIVKQYGRSATIDPSEAFVCGLLHDLGKAALDAVLPKSFTKVVEAADLLRTNIAELERNVIGLDHMIAGKRLAERWNLPASIRECIWLHGQHPQALGRGIASAPLVNLITLADQIAREQHIGYSGNYTFDIPRDQLLGVLGLTAQAVQSILPPLLERIEKRAGLLNLNVASSQELYQEAMKRANQELSRATTQLAVKNRRLATRARFFELLGDFHGRLRPDAPTDDVLAAISHCALGAIEAKSLVAFSLAPGDEYAQVLIFNENAELIDTTLVDCQERPISPSSDGPVQPASDPLHWLLAAVGPQLAGEKRFWICLRADTQCIGGILWAADAGESQRLGAQAQELAALCGAWQLALRMAQIRQESRQLAEQLAQANRELTSQQADLTRARLTTSVGEFAAGAAHEMNNPLAVIAGRSQLLAAQLADPKHQAAAKLIHEQSDRLSQIITDLMECARPPAPVLAACDVSDFLNAALKHAKARGDLADRTIETTMAEVPPVTVDHQQVASALTEIIVNALLATQQNGGRVQINAAFDSLSGRVAVTVSDDGIGMDDSTLRRAFDPFFSSQPAGRRRGLGLSKALRWLQGSGGTLKLESRPGIGTRAVVLLPAAEASQTPAVARAI